MRNIITLIAFISILSTDAWSQATPNAGFENWTAVSAFPSNYDVPNNWDNANPQTALTGTFSVEKATGGDVHTGSAAVKLITKNIFGNDVPGVVTTGTLPTSAGNPITGGVAYTLRPDSIVGWYKCNPLSGDNGFAEFTLFGSAANNADTIAEARFNTPTTAVGTYTRFSAPLVYYSTNTVANSMWLLGSSNSDVSLVVNSTAFYDDLDLIINPLVADVSVAQTVGSSTICAGESVTFTATPTNGGSSPVYQWQIDGSNVGTNSTTFTTTALTNGQVVTCILTSNLPGVIGSPVTSSGITITVNAIPSTPTASSNTPICEGAAINLTTATVSGATYSWTGPGSYTSGSQNPTLSSSTTAMAGTYSLTITVSGCTSVAGSTTVVVDPVVTPAITISITAGGNPTCTGQSMTYTAVATDGGSSPVYQWKLNNVNVGTNSTTYTNGTIVDTDVITCDLTSNAVCATSSTATSNAITMTVTSTVTPAVSIAVTVGNNPACASESISFTASPTNGGSAPGYQWQVDASNVGTDTSVYSSTSLTDGQVVTCIMTSNSGCASPSTATSSAVTMTVTQPVTPSVTTAVTSGTNPVCEGESIGFTATPTNGGTTPSYQWQVDGSNVGTDSTSFTTSILTDGQIVTCILTNLECASPATATSTDITVAVTTVVTPTISKSGAVLTSSEATGNQWYLDGVLIPGAINQTHTATQDGDYTVVVTKSGCTSAVSAAVSITLTGIGELNNGFSFSIYPNPSEGAVNVLFDASVNSTYLLAFRNVLGQVVYQETIERFQGHYSNQINISQYGAGMYVVSITGVGEVTKISKLFIQR